MKEATENFDLGAIDWGASDDDVKEVVKEVKKVEVKKVKVEHKKEKTENKGKKYDTYSYESKTKKVKQTYGINKPSTKDGGEVKDQSKPVKTYEYTPPPQKKPTFTVPKKVR